MSAASPTLCTAFLDQQRLLTAPLPELALALKQALSQQPTARALVFDDRSGRIVDLDLRGSEQDILLRLQQPVPSGNGRYRSATDEASAGESKTRGRPKLGVVAREVTLLPRQWEWLATQPGGASAALRRLVDQARRDGGDAQQQRERQEAAYHFMHAMAGDLPGFEAASRALFAGQREQLVQTTVVWPIDIRTHLLRLFDGPSLSP